MTPAKALPKNNTEAVRWFRMAAEQGLCQWAQRNLGHMYSDGRGVPKNDAEAARWYRKAAEQGDVNGRRYNLGVIRISTAEGIPKEYVQAYVWI